MSIKNTASVTGVGTLVLQVPPGTGSIYRIELDCANAAQVVTVRSKSVSGSGFKGVDASDKTVVVDVAAAFDLPGAVALQFTPSDAATSFTVRVVRAD
jgi:hypothetical protein